MNRILIVGCHGLLGQKLVETFSRQAGYTLKLVSIEDRSFFQETSLDYTQLDITSRNAVKGVVDQFHPEVILNAAAYTDVDGCEKERELAWRVNVGGVENLIAAARGSQSKIVHISSDYIFDGTNGPTAKRIRRILLVITERQNLQAKMPYVEATCLIRFCERWFFMESHGMSNRILCCGWPRAFVMENAYGLSMIKSEIQRLPTILLMPC